MAKSTLLIPEKTLEKAVELLKTLGHNDRLQIANILLTKECHVGELVNTLGTLQSQTSQQLGILKVHGVAKSKREGNKVFYSLANNSIREIVKSIVDAV